MKSQGKRTYICCCCKVSARRSIYSDNPVICSKCHQQMIGISKKVEIPKKDDDKGWRKVLNQYELRWEYINELAIREKRISKRSL